jgi:hypothetical protein
MRGLEEAVSKRVKEFIIEQHPYELEDILVLTHKEHKDFIIEITRSKLSFSQFTQEVTSALFDTVFEEFSKRTKRQAKEQESFLKRWVKDGGKAYECLADISK